MIAIIDYSIGNVKSLFNALSFLDSEVIITSEEEKIMSADKVILPGVGAYGKGMAELKKRDMPRILKRYVDSGKPLLGICLGMQLLMEESEEFDRTEGLGFIEGKVIKFPPSTKGKLPHVSWNELIKKENSWKDGLLDRIKSNQEFS